MSIHYEVDTTIREVTDDISTLTIRKSVQLYTTEERNQLVKKNRDDSKIEANIFDAIVEKHHEIANLFAFKEAFYLAEHYENEIVMRNYFLPDNVNHFKIRDFLIMSGWLDPGTSIKLEKYSKIPGESYTYDMLIIRKLPIT